jgi:hypothetical protein
MCFCSLFDLRLIDISSYLRETAQRLSKEQTTEILGKFAEFEATYTSETRNFCNALVKEKKSRKSFLYGKVINLVFTMNG